MKGHDTKVELFDVFLCHNGEDKPAVLEISQRLVKAGLKPWLDTEQIRPGTLWQKALGQQIESIKSAAVFVGKNGIGPWQDEEIQALLSEFMRRNCPVIPTVLRDAASTPELPWTLRNRHWVDFRVPEPDPLRQLIWGITGVKSIAPEPLIPREDNATPRTKFSEARLYPPLAQAPDQEQAIQLNILRKRVSEYWVNGVLKHSLYNEVLISLGKREVGNAVDAPWKYTVEVSGATDATPLDDRDVSAIFDATGLLLILGEPGSGKTTTLLDLARTLLDRAGDDIKERVAVVLNLSSWKKKKSMEEWISNELSEKYRVPRKIARVWLQHGYLLPLLDGLDEIETSTQPDCVTAINAFIEEVQPFGLVVCCRLNEYRWLPRRLKLNGAICIEPLSPEEVSKYLAAGGPKLVALHEAVGTDPVLQELAQTPFMLSIMSLAFQGTGDSEFTVERGDSYEVRRKRIFGLYVEKMLQRKGTGSFVFRKEKIIGWLSWLAGKMREHSQSIFLVEGLQCSWLGTRVRAYRTIVGLGYGLMVGFIFGLTAYLNGDHLNGKTLSLVLVFSFFGGVGGALRERPLKPITLVEAMSWEWSQFMARVILGLIIGAIAGLILALIFVLATFIAREPLYNALIGLGIGLTFGLIGGVIWGLFAGFRHRAKMGKSSPNQGIKLSLKNSLTAFLITCLTVWLITWLPFALILRWHFSPLEAGLGWPLILGLIIGFNQGGSSVIKHYALRLILWLSGRMPLNYVKSLDHCAKLIFLKKVGGGYIFIHRMLLDYFADLPPPQRLVRAPPLSRSRKLPGG